MSRTARTSAFVIANLTLALASFPQPARAGGDDKISPWVTAATGSVDRVLVVLAERAG
jgi:hypothetical protein